MKFVQWRHCIYPEHQQSLLTIDGLCQLPSLPIPLPKKRNHLPSFCSVVAAWGFFFCFFQLHCASIVCNTCSHKLYVSKPTLTFSEVFYLIIDTLLAGYRKELYFIKLVKKLSISKLAQKRLSSLFQLIQMKTLALLQKNSVLL